MKNIIILIAMMVIPAVAGAKERLPELKTIEYLDVDRGAGVWYEIARFTHWYERGFVGVEASYKLLANGKLDIVNTWRKGSPEGKLKIARGKGMMTDKRTNAKLKVCFFWPFYGAYWIIDIGKDYEYMVIGEPDRDSLWIFCRKPTMDPEVYNGILERLKEQRYDITRLEKTPQYGLNCKMQD